MHNNNQFTNNIKVKKQKGKIAMDRQKEQNEIKAELAKYAVFKHKILTILIDSL